MGLVAASLVLLALAGWIFDIRILTSLVPDGPTMKFNSAVLMALAVAALLLNVYRPRLWCCTVIPIVLVSVGLLTLAEDVLGIRLGIDEWLIRDHFGGGVENDEPGRMATTSALAFVAMGFGYFGIRRPRFVVWAQISFHFVTLIAFVAAIGYLVGAPDFYTLSFLSAMSLPAGICFFLLSIAGAFLAPGKGLPALFAGNKLGSQVARRVFPAYLLIIIGLAAGRVALHRSNWIDVEFGIGLFAIGCALAGLILISRSAEWINRAEQKRYKAQIDLETLNASLEQTVKERTAEIQSILDSAQVAIIATDARGQITHFSRGAQTMLGYTEAEARVHLNFEALHVPEEIGKMAVALSRSFRQPVRGFGVFKLLARKTPDTGYRWTYLHKQGTQHPVQAVMSPMRSASGHIRGYLGVAVDVSELDKVRGSLELLAERLQRKNAQLLNFAHVASHNLRTPVHNLAALMQLHHSSDDTHEQAFFLEKVDSVVLHLKETLNDLLESLRVQEDPDISETALVLEEVFAQVADQFSAQVVQGEARLTADFSAAPVISFYRPYLESILTNLISNALKYRSPDRLPEVRVYTEVLPDQSVALSVADNGLGIDLERHGDKLFGLNKTFHAHPEARGVGLFIVKAQAEALGARMLVNSKPGVGSKFSLVLKKAPLDKVAKTEKRPAVPRVLQ